MAYRRLAQLRPSRCPHQCERCGALKPLISGGRFDVDSFFPNADTAQSVAGAVVGCAVVVTGAMVVTGHGCALHARVSFSAGHGALPAVTTRARSCVPPPHVLEQSPVLHADVALGTAAKALPLATFHVLVIMSGLVARSMVYMATAVLPTDVPTTQPLTASR